MLLYDYLWCGESVLGICMSCPVPRGPQWITWGPSFPTVPAEAKHDASADRLIWSDGEVWAAELQSFRDELSHSKEQPAETVGSSQNIKSSSQISAMRPTETNLRACALKICGLDVSQLLR